MHRSFFLLQILFYPFVAQTIWIVFQRFIQQMTKQQLKYIASQKKLLKEQEGIDKRAKEKNLRLLSN